MKKMYDIVIAIILALGAIISVAIFSNAIDRINKKIKKKEKKLCRKPRDGRKKKKRDNKFQYSG